MKYFALCLLLLSALPAFPLPSPIITRHDRDDAAYRALGEQYAASLCEVRVRDGRGVRVALGTLIGPRWVLTAAHVARGMGPGHSIRFQGHDYPVARVTLQPKWEGREHDLALIYLQESVDGAQPLPLYRWDDEVGQEIIFVGTGGSGTGETGPVNEDGLLRGATNRVYEAAPPWISFVFNAPGTPGVTDLEGISGPGDSGGPGILLREGKPFLAGVSSGQDAGPTGGKAGRYGVIEYYTRVSHFVDWIEQTMKAVAEDDIVQGDLGEALDAYLSEQVSKDFSGSVLVATADGVVLEKGYGLADRSRNIPNTSATIFPLGSIVKVFTRGAIEHLADAGKLSLDDPLTRFFIEVPYDKQSITVQHLLDHRSGLAAYHDEEGDFEEMDRAEALERIFAQELRLEPGEGRSYSNSGYTLLAAIIENASGHSYTDYVMEKLIQPTGLMHTGFYRDPRWMDDRVAIGYEGDTFGTINSPKYWPGPTWALMGSGGMGSTVRDLYTWMETRMQQRGFSPKADAEHGQKSGQELLDDAVAFAAGGGNYGNYAVTVVLPDGTMLVVMSNASKEGVEDENILASLASLRYGGEPVRPAPPQSLTTAQLAETPAGQKMLAMIEALNAGTDEATRTFLAEHMDEGFQQDEQGVLKDFAGIRERIGPNARISYAVQPNPYRVEAFLQNGATGEWLKIALGVERDAPHPIAGLGLSLEAPPLSPGSASDCDIERGLPESPVGRAADALLAALCHPDEKAHRAFIETGLEPTFRDQFPMEQHVEMFERMHNDFGTSRVTNVVEKNPHKAEINLEGSGRSLRLMLEVAPTEPHKITSVGIGPGGEGGSAGMSSARTESLEGLQDYIQNLAADDTFSGAVLIAKNGDVLFEQAYGMADLAQGIPNRVDTKFNLGSNNKMFTALAIAQLAEQGKLAFDDPIEKHLPDYPNQETAEQVTIHHLLTHTSGLGFYPFDHGKKTPADILPFFADEPLAFTPGSDMQYSNAGFLVLGMIVERVSGEDYYDYIQHHIFEPARMTDSGSFAHDETIPDRAIPYTQDGSGPRQPATEMLELKGSPAGGGYSTVHDMLRFGEALRNHTLLGPSYTDILLTGKVDMGPGLRYAYGFGDHRRDGNRSVGHMGGAPGVGADFKLYLDKGFSAIVFSNYDARVVMDISRKIADWVAAQQT